MIAESMTFYRHSILSFISNLNYHYSQNEFYPARKTKLEENRTAESTLKSVDGLFTVTSNIQFIHSIEDRYQFLNPIFGTIHMITVVMRQGNDTVPGKQVITKHYFSEIELNEEWDILSNEGTRKAKGTVQRNSKFSNFTSFRFRICFSNLWIMLNKLLEIKWECFSWSCDFSSQRYRRTRERAKVTDFGKVLLR